MQLEIGTVHHFLVTREGYHASSYLYVLCAQLRQLFRQNGLKSHKGLGDKFKILCHNVLYKYGAKIRISTQKNKINSILFHYSESFV